ncbi:NAD dependent epimerase/dehydratase family protein [Acetobacteraceae bacterium AT-5844]|nr:NAD dependent epimerase/dehydratase family protein [Acetobacteraceae bacterium AT-5844]
MRVLVTGGAGFLGAWVARRLLAAGHQVRIFDRSQDRRLVHSILSDAATVEWCHDDITQAEAVESAAEGCGGIVHLAAMLTPACQANPVLGAQVNLIGTLNVFEAAKRHRIRSVTYASSAGVFGADDGAIPYPDTHYGAFKLACEGSARAYWHDAGIGSVGFRPLVIYGPGREVGGSAGPTIACRKALAGEAYAIPFTGETDMIYVDDVAAAFEAAVTRTIAGAHVFNLRGEVTTVTRILAEIEALVPGARLSAAGGSLPVTAHIAAHDTSSVLGPLPHTSLREGLSRTVQYYRDRLEAQREGQRQAS